MSTLIQILCAVFVLIVLVAIYQHRSRRFWKLNKGRHLVALKSFSIRHDTYGYDVLKGQIGAYIPSGTRLPSQTEMFWVDVSSNIGGTCDFGANVIVGRDCTVNDSSLGAGTELRDRAKVYNTTVGVKTNIGVNSVVFESKIGDYGWILFDTEIHKTHMEDNCNVLANSNVVQCKLASHSTVGYNCQFRDTTLMDNVKVTDNVCATGRIIPHNVPCDIVYDMEQEMCRKVLGGEFIVLSGERQPAMIFKLDDEYYLSNFNIGYKLSELDTDNLNPKTCDELIALIKQWKIKLLEGE